MQLAPDPSSFNKARPEADDAPANDNVLARSSSDDKKQATPLDKCATQSATAEARPVYLVFMFDQASSSARRAARA